MKGLGGVLVVAVLATPVAAQPVDPYEPSLVDPAPSGLDHEVGLALVVRAEALMAEGHARDAQRLANEALTRSGAAEVDARARAIIRRAIERDSLERLRADDLAVVPGLPTVVVRQGPRLPSRPAVDDGPASTSPTPTRPAGVVRGPVSGAVHGGLLGAVMVGGLAVALDDDAQLWGAGALPGAAAGAAVGYLAGRRMTPRHVAMAGSTGLWGAIVGGALGDQASGGTGRAAPIFAGQAGGALAGAVLGGLLVDGGRHDGGAIALMDVSALAGIALGINTAYMVEGDLDESTSAYVVVASTGAWALTAWATRDQRVGAARAFAIAGGAALGGAVPWLLSRDSERAAGFSNLGVVVGGVVGWWLAPNEVDGARAGATALASRTAAGTWALGVPWPRTTLHDGAAATTFALADGVW